jgi:hypothetical protein
MFPTCFKYCHVLECLSTGFRIGYRIYYHLRIATTANYNSPTEPHTPNITATAAHIKVLCLH